MENSPDGKDARSKIKTKVLDAFKEEEKNKTVSIFKEFYPLVKIINRVFK
jgi:hypothetical protein